MWDPEVEPLADGVFVNSGVDGGCLVADRFSEGPNLVVPAG